MNAKCHACGRELPNRSRRSCPYCDAILGELRRDRGEFLEKLKREETKRHRDFMEREISTSGGGMPNLPGML
jgi:hypothetical protein